MKPLGFLLAAALIVQVHGANKKTEQLASRLDQLQKEYNTLLDRLETVTQNRWRAREEQVSQKERDKEKLDKLRQAQERLYGDVARAREERLAREQVAEREADALNVRADEWRFMADAIDAKVAAQAQAALVGFPLNQDAYHQRIVALENRFSARSNPSRKLEASLALALDRLRSLTTIKLGRHTIIAGQNEPMTAQVLRLGHAVAYGVGTEGQTLILTADAEGSHYSWEPVTNEKVAAQVATLISGALTQGVLRGNLPIDILQNDYSRALVGAPRLALTTKVITFVKAGGIVLIPLGLIVVWALGLTLGRLFLFSRTHHNAQAFLSRALMLLGEHKLDEVQTLAKREHGVLARILGTCLDNAQWNRSAAEKAVKELLLKEVPLLDRHLDTLAVLAAASPLLGLLGTVTGMISMFEAITRFGTGDPKLLAGGISEALITTEVGLSIAIPLLLIHNFLRNRRNRIQSDMELSAMSILNRLWPEH